MKVRFIKDWQAYKVGDIITPYAAFGTTLIKKKLAEEVKTLTLRKKNVPKNTRNSANH